MDTIVRWEVFAAELCLILFVLYWVRRTQSRRDRFPWPFLGQLLLWGGITAIIAAFVELRFSLDPREFSSSPLLINSINSLAPSLVEELAKYMIGVFLVLTTSHAHKLSDTLLYFVLIGLGFSLLEDVFFLLDPDTVAPYRLLSFYVHAGTGAMIGYAVGRFKFGLSGYGRLIATLFLAVAVHGLYNFSVQPDYVGWAFPISILLAVAISLQIFVLFLRTRLLDRELRAGIRPIRHAHRAHYFKAFSS